MTGIELISRAVIRLGDEVLLAHKIGEENTFLPGGHIESGEYAEDALNRELREELGVESKILGFVGILEHKFTEEDGRSHEEINLIFEADIEGTSVESAEGHLEFKYVNPKEFNAYVLLPSSLSILLKKWLRDCEPFHYAQRV